MLTFSKMHGLGNDFIVIDAIHQSVDLTVDQIKFIADRHFGIGCDQVLLVEPPTVEQADFKYRIFNADGSEVAQCGNGVRCFARFVVEKGLTQKQALTVETASGLVYPQLHDNGEVTVDMGAPRFDAKAIPFLSDEKQQVSYSLALSNGQQVTLSVLSMGNPHAVMLVDNIADADVAELGPLIEQHDAFPERVNAGFMQVVNRHRINLRVYERGTGETKACGTGACAAVVSGIQQGLLARQNVEVNLPGGLLNITWEDDAAPVLMSGPATHVFDGEIAWPKIQKK